MDKPTFSAYQAPEEKNINTLNEQLQRLKHYISLLRTEARYLGNEQIGDKADALQQIVNTSDLQAITRALLTIEKLEVDQVGDNAAGYKITIPKGYYDKETIIDTIGTNASTEVTNAPGIMDVVAGKDYWANGAHLTGTLSDNSGERVSATSTNADTAKENETITVKIPVAKYDGDSVIDTGITVHTTYSYDAEVTVSTDEEGKEHAKVKAFDIPAGYYDKPIAIYPIFKDGETYESVLNVKKLTVNKSGTFDPHAEKTPDGNGFDYYSEVSVPRAQIASLAGLTASTATALISINNQGFTDSSTYSVSLPTQTAPSAVDTSASTAIANVTVTPNIASVLTVTIPAGLYKLDTIVKVKSMADSGKTLTSQNISVKDTPVAKTDKDGNTTAYTVNVSINKDGYIATGDYEASDLGVSTISTVNVAGTTITSKNIKISTNEGYTKGETKDLTVQDANISTLTPSKETNGNGSITIDTSTPGWFENKTVNLTATQINTLVTGLTTVGTLTYSSTNTANSEAIANVEGAVVNSITGSYYNSVDMSELLSEMSSL